MQKNTLGTDVEFFVRGKREATLLMRSSPMLNSSQVQVNNKITSQTLKYLLNFFGI